MGRNIFAPFVDFQGPHKITFLLFTLPYNASMTNLGFTKYQEVSALLTILGPDFSIILGGYIEVDNNVRMLIVTNYFNFERMYQNILV